MTEQMRCSIARKYSIVAPINPCNSTSRSCPILPTTMNSFPARVGISMKSIHEDAPIRRTNFGCRSEGLFHPPRPLHPPLVQSNLVDAADRLDAYVEVFGYMQEVVPEMHMDLRARRHRAVNRHESVVKLLTSLDRPFGMVGVRSGSWTKARCEGHEYLFDTSCNWERPRDVYSYDADVMGIDHSTR